MLGVSPLLARLLAVTLFALVIAEPFVQRVFIDMWSDLGFDSHHLEFDFVLFYRAAEDLQAGRSPYPEEIVNSSLEEPAARAWNRYLYPPAFARLFIPFTAFSPWIAYRLFVALNFILYLVVLVPWRARGASASAERWVSLALLFLWGPAIETLRKGQTNLIPLLLLMLALVNLERVESGVCPRKRAREFGAGFFFGIGAMVKLVPLVVAPLLAVAGRVWLLLGIAVGSIGLLAVCDPGQSWVYFTRVFPTLGDFPDLRRSHSLNALVLRGLDRLLAGGWVSGEILNFDVLIAGGVSAAFFIAVGAIVFLRRKQLSASTLLLLGCYLQAILVGRWSHHYTAVLIPSLFTARALASQWVRTPFPDREIAAGEQSPISRNRLLVLSLAELFALLPNFYYLPPVNALLHALEGSKEIVPPDQLVLANLLGMGVFLYLVLQNGSLATTQNERTHPSVV
ncbi:MAG: DUF2029 domain-containing protein [Candidatus Omnitrophica bacterium]|nr:hypothetical protein [bacterium]NUN94981.1 DUF2029 domain-containing protein [Candidatus Omnitrophota bacterium]